MASVTFKGNTMELTGNLPNVGDAAPDFQLVANDLSKVSLKDSAGKVRIISAVPSIDTGVCSIETARFNKEMDNLPGNVVGYTVSVDLPFAQKRWCGAEGVEKMQLLSDYRDHAFSKGYGIYLDDLALSSRVVFIVDQNDKIAYVQVVPEVTHEPDYDAVINKAKELAG